LLHCSARADRHSIGTLRHHDMQLTGVISLPTFNRGMADQQCCSSIHGR
jgi:hypothetical protein